MNHLSSKDVAAWVFKIEATLKIDAAASSETLVYIHDRHGVKSFITNVKAA
jgi:hypothetical protein